MSDLEELLSQTPAGDSSAQESSDVPMDDAAAGRKPAAELGLKEAIQEHAEMMAMLPQYVRDVTKKLDTMRMAGIPDRAAYEKFSKDLDEVYRRFNEVSQRVIDFQEGTEDAYRAAKERERQWSREEEAAVHGRKRETDQPPFEERKTPLELYDEEVRKLLAEALELESNAEVYGKSGMIEKLRPSMRADIVRILEKLRKLNEQRSDTAPSREYESLVDVLIHVNDLLEAPEAVAVAFSPLSESRMAYRIVKAEYAAVQHTLSEEQRRTMRLSIASLNESVRQAEDEAWSGMFGTAFSKTAAAQFEPIPPPEPPARPDIRGAIARATEHAPAIATAALASLPKAISKPQVAEPRGFLAAIGDAFKLK